MSAKSACFFDKAFFPAVKQNFCNIYNVKTVSKFLVLALPSSSGELAEFQNYWMQMTGILLYILF